MNEIGVYRLNVGSCNGCDIEVLSVLASRFGLGNLKAKIVEEPEQANVLIVAGVVTVKMAEPLKEVYAKLKEPKAVVAMGACGLSNGIFQRSYSAMEPSDTFIPVNSYIPGCPPGPQAIADGVARALKIKYRRWAAPKGFRGPPELDEEKCTGCSACAMACPAFAIELVDEGNKRTVKYMYDKCINCATCEEVCPYDAVHLAKRRHPSWPDRGTMGTSADEPLASCPVCGAFEVPEKQVKSLADRIISEVRQYENFRGKIERAAAVCTRCRGRVTEIAGAKGLLFTLMQSLTQGARGSSR